MYFFSKEADSLLFPPVRRLGGSVQNLVILDQFHVLVPLWWPGSKYGCQQRFPPLRLHAAKKRVYFSSLESGLAL